MSIQWVSSVKDTFLYLVDDVELDPDEVARDARLLRWVVLFSVAMLVGFSVVLSMALRMLLG